MCARSDQEKDVCHMVQVTEKYYKNEFWAKENLIYLKPHFRLTKAARIINSVVNERSCDLLDVGCGPATLARLLKKNINYHGVDIAIHDPAPNLIQQDFLESPIAFNDKRFDIVVAQGVFEYVGRHQAEKLADIRNILKKNGTFLLSYVNFDHLHRFVYQPYSNVQPFAEFRRSVAREFRIDRCVPTSYHWRHHEPNREFMKALQIRINVNIPWLSRLFAVEYFLVCSPR
jgi:SAM-dependent methyltransferase